MTDELILALNCVKLAEPGFTANSFYVHDYVGLLLHLLPAHAIVVKTTDSGIKWVN